MAPLPSNIANDKDFAIRTVLNGPSIMPSYRDTLTNANIAAVLTHVYTSWGNTGGTVTEAQVAWVIAQENPIMVTLNESGVGESYSAEALVTMAPPAGTVTVSFDTEPKGGIDLGGSNLFAQIGLESGVVLLDGSPNYEHKKAHTITIRIEDDQGALVERRLLVLNVANIVEHPGSGYSNPTSAGATAIAITLEWFNDTYEGDFPAEEDRASIVVSYGSGTSFRGTVSVPPDQTEAVVTGLTPETAYTLTVRWYSQDGSYGDSTATVSVMTGALSRPPVFNAIGDALVLAGQEATVTLTQLAEDPDSGPVFFSVKNAPAWLGYDGSTADTLLLEPGATTPAGIHTVTITGMDEDGNPATTEASVVIYAPNPPELLRWTLADGNLEFVYNGDVCRAKNIENFQAEVKIRSQDNVDHEVAFGQLNETGCDNNNTEDLIGFLYGEVESNWAYDATSRSEHKLIYPSPSASFHFKFEPWNFIFGAAFGSFEFKMQAEDLDYAVSGVTVSVAEGSVAAGHKLLTITLDSAIAGGAEWLAAATAEKAATITPVSGKENSEAVIALVNSDALSYAAGSDNVYARLTILARTSDQQAASQVAAETRLVVEVLQGDIEVTATLDENSGNHELYSNVVNFVTIQKPAAFGPTVVFSIVSGDDFEDFDIGHATGVLGLKVQKNFNYEVKDMYTLTINVADVATAVEAKIRFVLTLNDIVDVPEYYSNLNLSFDSTALVITMSWDNSDYHAQFDAEDRASIVVSYGSGTSLRGTVVVADTSQVTTTVTLAGLTAETTYTITIRWYSEDGSYGDATETQEFTTDPLGDPPMPGFDIFGIIAEEGRARAVVQLDVLTDEGDIAYSVRNRPTWLGVRFGSDGSGGIAASITVAATAPLGRHTITVVGVDENANQGTVSIAVQVIEPLGLASWTLADGKLAFVYGDFCKASDFIDRFIFAIQDYDVAANEFTNEAVCDDAAAFAHGQLYGVTVSVSFDSTDSNQYKLFLPTPPDSFHFRFVGGSLWDRDPFNAEGAAITYTPQVEDIDYAVGEVTVSVAEGSVDAGHKLLTLTLDSAIAGGAEWLVAATAEKAVTITPVSGKENIEAEIALVNSDTLSYDADSDNVYARLTILARTSDQLVARQVAVETRLVVQILPGDIAVTATIDENSGNLEYDGDLTIAIMPKPESLGESVAFSIVSGDDFEDFFIESDSGALFVNSQKNFNHEVKDMYTLTINAADADTAVEVKIRFVLTLNDIVEEPEDYLNTLLSVEGENAFVITMSWENEDYHDQFDAEDRASIVVSYGSGTSLRGTVVVADTSQVTTTVTLAGLTPETAYTITVRWYSEDGSYGDSTETRVGTTEPLGDPPMPGFGVAGIIAEEGRARAVVMLDVLRDDGDIAYSVRNRPAWLGVRFGSDGSGGIAASITVAATAPLGRHTITVVGEDENANRGTVGIAVQVIEPVGLASWTLADGKLAFVYGDFCKAGDILTFFIFAIQDYDTGTNAFTNEVACGVTRTSDSGSLFKANKATVAINIDSTDSNQYKLSLPTPSDSFHFRFGGGRLFDSHGFIAYTPQVGDLDYAVSEVTVSVTESRVDAGHKLLTLTLGSAVAGADWSVAATAEKNVMITEVSGKENTEAVIALVGSDDLDYEATSDHVYAKLTILTRTSNQQAARQAARQVAVETRLVVGLIDVAEPNRIEADRSGLSALTPSAKTGTVPVQLASQPTGGQNVTVTVSSVPADLEVLPAHLVFTPTNWDTAQDMTVSLTDAAIKRNGNINVNLVVHDEDNSAANYRRVSALPVAVAVNIPNIAPVFAAAQRSRSRDESVGSETTASDSAIGTPIVATDADSVNAAEFRYSINPDSLRFGIAGMTGQLTLKLATKFNHERTPSYTVTVEVHDGEHASVRGRATVTVSINITDVDEAPASYTSANLTVTGVDRTRITLSWNNNEYDAQFDLPDRASIVVSYGSGSSFRGTMTASVFDTALTLTGLSASTAYTMTIRWYSADGLFGDSTNTLSHTTATNQVPVFVAPLLLATVPENSGSVGMTVGSVFAEDEDLDSIAYSIVAGADAAGFGIGSVSGDITISTAQTFDYESKDKYTINVRASDGASGVANGVFVLSIRNVDEPPAFLSSRHINRVALVGVPRTITLVAASDPEGAVIYSIPNKPSWITRTGRVLDVNAENADRGLHTITIVATDTGSKTANLALTLEVIAEPSLAKWKLQAGKPRFEIATEACASLKKFGSGHGITHYSIGINYNNGEEQSITLGRNVCSSPIMLMREVGSGGSNAQVSYVASDSNIVVGIDSVLGMGRHAYMVKYSFRERFYVGELVRMEAFYSKLFNLTYDLSAVTITVAEVAGAGTAAAGYKLGTLTLDNAVANAQWSLVGTPQEDVGLAAVSGSETTEGALSLTSPAVLDFEAGAGFVTITVEVVTPDTEASLEQAIVEVVLELGNVNEPPVFATAFPDQRVSSVDGGTFTFHAATDPDAGDALTYSAKLADGTALTGGVSFNASSRVFTVARGAAEATFTISVAVQDAAGLMANQKFELQLTREGINADRSGLNLLTRQNRTEVLPVKLDGAPSGANVTVTLTSANAGHVAVAPAHMVFTPGNWKQVQNANVSLTDAGLRDKSSRNVNIQLAVHSRSTSATNYRSVQPVSVPIAVNVVNAAPTFAASHRSRNMDENTGAATTAAGTSVGAPILAGDEDNEAADFRYSINPASSLFGIGERTGQLTVSADTNFDHEVRAAYTVTVEVHDNEVAAIRGKATVTVAIGINPVDEPPVFAGSQPDRVALVGVARTLTLVAASDPEGAVTYSIPGKPSWITRTGRELVVNADNAARGLHTITLVATDTGSNTANLALKLDVIPEPSLTSWKLQGGKPLLEIASEACASYKRFGRRQGVDAFSISQSTDLFASAACDGSVRTYPSILSGFNFRFEDDRQVYERISAVGLGRHSYAILYAFKDDSGFSIYRRTFNLTYDLSAVTITVAEEAGTTAAGHKFGTLTLDNAVANAQWSLVGTPREDVGLAAVSGSGTTEGALTLTSPAVLDFEAGAGFVTITVEAVTPDTEARLEQAIVEVVIELSDVNEPPVFASELLDQRVSGVSGGTFTFPEASDPENPGVAVTYSASLADGTTLPTGGVSFNAGSRVFTVARGSTEITLTIKVVAEDTDSLTAEQLFELQITKEGINASASGSLTRQNRTEVLPVKLDGAPSGANVTVTLTSANAGHVAVAPAHMVFTPGNWNQVQNANVSLTDAGLRVKGSRSVNVELAVHNQSSSATNYRSVPAVQVAIAVNVVNAAPTFAASQRSRNIDENTGAATTAAGTRIGAPITATDEDNNDAADLMYSINPASSLFGIGERTGQLTVSADTNFDHEVKDAYTVIVEVHDNEAVAIRGKATVTVAIGINPVNEPPMLGALLDQTVIEGIEVSYQIDPAVDPDAGNAITYSATQANGSPLPPGVTFDSDRLVRTFTFAATLTGQTVTLRVTASDGLASEQQDFVLWVRDAGGILVQPEVLPELARTNRQLTFRVRLDVQPQTKGVTLTLESSDASDVAVAPVTMEFDRSNWNVVQNATLSLSDSGAQELTDRTVSLAIEVYNQSSSDDFYRGSRARSIAVQVANENAVPDFGRAREAFIIVPSRVEEVVASRVVGTVTAVDGNGDAITYTIAPGDDAALFTIDAQSGRIEIVGTAEDVAELLELGSSYSFTVQARDGFGGVGQLAVQVRTPVPQEEKVALSVIDNAIAFAAVDIIQVRVDAPVDVPIDAPDSSGQAADEPLYMRAGSAEEQWRDWRGDGSHAAGDSGERVQWRDFLYSRGFDFALNGTGSRGPQLRFWGRGSRTSLKGNPLDGDVHIPYSGDVNVFMLGLEAGLSNRIIGLAAGSSKGKFTIGDTNARVRRELKSVHPYASFRISDRVRFWLSGGLGTGDYARAGSDGRETVADTTYLSAAGGIKTAFRHEDMEIGTGLKMMQMQSKLEETEDLPGSKARFWRVQADFESGWPHNLSPETVFSPLAGLNIRYDGGNGPFEYGTALDAIAGMRLNWSGGLRTQLNYRWQVHKKDARERSIDGSISYDHRSDGRGLMLSVSPKAVSTADTSFAPTASARVGYGLPVRLFADSGIATVSADFSYTETSVTDSYGFRFAGRRLDVDLSAAGDAYRLNLKIR